MAFNKMRRRPIQHSTISEVVEVDVNWLAQGSLPITAWNRFMQGGLASSVGAGVASIQRIASGQFQVFFSEVGEKLINAWVDIAGGQPGFIASYDAYLGSYTPPFIASGSYTGKQASLGYLTIYTVPKATASLGTLGDVSSLAIASIMLCTMWSDADY